MFGWTVPQPDIFYGAPLLAARLGATGVTGPMVSQACATSVACLDAAAGRVSAGGGVRLVVTTAPVSAARAALAADITIDQVDAVTTHNPFAVNDIYFARATGFPLDRMNSHGCSLIFGHPQGPTGLRSVTELIEELRQRGGGTGLFTGCAAGDTGAAIVIQVTD